MLFAFQHSLPGSELTPLEALDILVLQAPALLQLPVLLRGLLTLEYLADLSNVDLVAAAHRREQLIHGHVLRAQVVHAELVHLVDVVLDGDS